MPPAPTKAPRDELDVDAMSSSSSSSTSSSGPSNAAGVAGAADLESVMASSDDGMADVGLTQNSIDVESVMATSSEEGEAPVQVKGQPAAKRKPAMKKSAARTEGRLTKEGLPRGRGAPPPKFSQATATSGSSSSSSSSSTSSSSSDDSDGGSSVSLGSLKSLLEETDMVPGDERFGEGFRDDDPMCGIINEVSSEFTSKHGLDVVDDGKDDVYEQRVRFHKLAAARVRKRRKMRARALKERLAVRTATGDMASEEGSQDSFSPDGGSEDGDDEDDFDMVFLADPKHTEKRLGDAGESLRISEGVYNSLFPYQRTCVKWLWELHQQRVGGIVGDEMGLGKTIQIISFLHGLQRSELLLGAVLIVCPVTLIKQWIREFHKWAPEFRIVAMHSAAGSFNGNHEKVLASAERHMTKSVVIATYAGMKAQIEALIHFGFHYVILDEGHHIRTPNGAISQAAKRFPTPHRLVLTGSPLQNRLSELWAIFDFVYPGRLGALPDFSRLFEVPINTGGFEFATAQQAANGYGCCVKLRDLIAPYLLRRLKKDVQAQLPQKTETVLFCRLTLPQVIAYVEYLSGSEMKTILRSKADAHGRINRREDREYRSKVRNADLEEVSRKGPVEDATKKPQSLTAINTLRKICNHPQLFQNESPDGTPMEIDIESSGKLRVVAYLLQRWKEEGHRCLLFSQSLQMLDIFQDYMTKEGYRWLRMDGSTPVNRRNLIVETFNKDPRYFVALLTPKVGGLGVNLTGANRVIIFDPDWNPVTDVQARERAWRIGQTKEVVIYRLITMGTIEEKVYQRQVFKSHLTDRVLADPTQRKTFDSQELKALWTLSSEYKDVYKEYRRAKYADEIAKKNRGVSPPRDLSVGGDLDAALDELQAGPKVKAQFERAKRQDAQAFESGAVIAKEEAIEETSWGYRIADTALLKEGDQDGEASPEQTSGSGSPPPDSRKRKREESGTPPPPTPGSSVSQLFATPAIKRAGRMNLMDESEAADIAASQAAERLAAKRRKTAASQAAGAETSVETREMMSSLLAGDTIGRAEDYEQQMHSHAKHKGRSCAREAKRFAASAALELKKSGERWRKQLQKEGKLAAVWTRGVRGKMPEREAKTVDIMAKKDVDEKVVTRRITATQAEQEAAEAKKEAKRRFKLAAENQNSDDDDCIIVDPPPQPPQPAISQVTPASQRRPSDRSAYGFRPPKPRAQAPDEVDELYRRRKDVPMAGLLPRDRADTDVIPISLDPITPSQAQLPPRRPRRDPNLPHPPQPLSAAAPDDTLEEDIPLDDQIRIMIGEHREVETPHIVQMFGSIIGNPPGPGQLSISEFRTHLSRVAVYNKSIGKWKLRRRRAGM
eukprot:TRINITY_DN21077_c0_g1_i1.p1 TRINITY_DN21077_c0_g1~~TRINITY_DN21077_c0_g1_i1.p1  ORF type:complete len:1581 (+),score=568.08 TRINITY_DN21077_c0_g1_i1:704-4744(+)